MLSLIVVSSVLNVITWILFSELLWLHIYLKYKNLTTYEFIVIKREKKKEKLAKSQRALELGGVPICNNSNAKEADGQKKYKSKIIIKIDQSQSTTYDKSSLVPLNDNGIWSFNLRSANNLNRS